jgi:nucleoside-diphosphate-sugar epimerase
MKICILGSSGVVGYGIKQKLSKYKIISLNSKFYDFKKKTYKLRSINKNIDLFVHAGGVFDEEVKKNKKIAIRRASVNTIQLLDKLLKLKCKNYIYISSLRVYDDKANFLKENQTSLLLNDVYKLCHFITERIFINFCEKNKKNYLIIRPGAVYGFGENKINRQSLIPYSFPNELIKKNSITLKSSGQQYRNFCSNKDIGKLVSRWVLNKKKKSLITNINGRDTIKVIDFAKLSIKIFYKITKIKSMLILNSKKSQKTKKKLKIHQSYNFRSINKIEKFLFDYIKLLYVNKKTI